jgi:hypothetical protein
MAGISRGLQFGEAMDALRAALAGEQGGWLPAGEAEPDAAYWMTGGEMLHTKRRGYVILDAGRALIAELDAARAAGEQGT